nr:RNA-directed DNA polymerase, eukaryota, reverse transcriptase zinc-binding domain protein [Tanacetum cinerariifolium]
MRKHIEESTLGSTIGETKWNNTLPIKVYIFAWRLALDRLPTRFNLDSRGVDLDSGHFPNIARLEAWRLPTPKPPILEAKHILFHAIHVILLQSK